MFRPVLCHLTPNSRFHQLLCVSLFAALALTSQAQAQDSKLPLAAPSPTATATTTSTLPSVESADKATPANKLSLSASVLGKSYEDANVNQKMAGTLIGLTGERNFNSYLSGTIDIALYMLTGNFSSRYATEAPAPNTLLLNEASLTAKPLPSVGLSLGVLPVEFNSLAVSTWDGAGFPGVKESWSALDSETKLDLWASQTSPTSSTGAVKSSEGGVNSQLNLLGLTFQTNSKDTGDLTFTATATQFDFKNLTTSAATDSQYYGNSVIQVGNQARFKYEFRGYEATTSGLVKLGSRWQLEGVVGFLKNELAPRPLNQASMGQMNVYYLMDGVKLRGAFASFYNEADTLPASYTRSGLGNNNRFGWAASLKSDWEKQKVGALLKYVQANEIQDNLYTADRQILSFSVEAKYDVL